MRLCVRVVVCKKKNNNHFPFMFCKYKYGDSSLPAQHRSNITANVSFYRIIFGCK